MSMLEVGQRESKKRGAGGETRREKRESDPVSLHTRCLVHPFQRVRSIAHRAPVVCRNMTECKKKK